MSLLGLQLTITPPSTAGSPAVMAREDLWAMRVRWGADLRGDRLGPAVGVSSGHVEHQHAVLIPTEDLPQLKKPMPALLTLDGARRWSGVAIYGGRRDVDGELVVRHELRGAHHLRLDAQEISITLPSGTVADLARLFTAATAVPLDAGAAAAIKVGAVRYRGTAVTFLEQLGRFCGCIVAETSAGAWAMIRLAAPPPDDVGLIALSVGPDDGWIETEMLDWSRNAAVTVGRTLDSEDNPVEALRREVTAEANVPEGDRVRLRVPPWFAADLSGSVSNIVPTLRVRDIPPTTLAISYALREDSDGAAAVLKTLDTGQRWRIVTGAEVQSCLVASCAVELDDDAGRIELDTWIIDAVAGAADEPFVAIQSVDTSGTTATVHVAISDPPASLFSVWYRRKAASSTTWGNAASVAVASGGETAELPLSGLRGGVAYDVQAIYSDGAPTDWTGASQTQFTAAADLRLATVAVNGTDILGSDTGQARLAATISVTRGGSATIAATAVDSAAAITYSDAATITNITTSRAWRISVIVTSGGRSRTVIVTVQIDVTVPPPPPVDATLASVNVHGQSVTGLPRTDLAVSLFLPSAGASVTVRATPNDPDSTVRYSRQLVIFARNTSQTAVTRTATVTITVTNGTASTTYTLTITATVAAAPPPQIDLNFSGAGNVTTDDTGSSASASDTITGARDPRTDIRQWNFHANLGASWGGRTVDVTIRPTLASASRNAAVDWYNSSWSDSGIGYRTVRVTLPAFTSGSQRAQVWFRAELSQRGQTTRRYLIRLRLFR